MVCSDMALFCYTGSLCCEEMRRVLKAWHIYCIGFGVYSYSEMCIHTKFDFERVCWTQCAFVSVSGGMTVVCNCFYHKILN